MADTKDLKSFGGCLRASSSLVVGTIFLSFFICKLYNFKVMEYLLKKLTVNNEQISYYVKENNAKWTVLFVHGYNSSSDFASELFHLKQNFNIIALNLPGSHYLEKPRQGLSVNYFYQIINTFIKHHLRIHHLILLGHSLGGAVVAPLSKNKKVKRVIYLSPIHPHIIKSKSWKKLHAFYFPTNNNHKSNSEIESHLGKGGLYLDLIKNDLLNYDYITGTLNDEYKMNLRKKPLFIIGDNDHLIETKQFVEFVTKDLKQKIKIIPQTSHNPIQEKPYLFNDLLNREIRWKKRL